MEIFEPLLSSGAEAFLHRLSPHGQPEGDRAYPEGVDGARLRFQGKETVKQWFDRCVREFMPDGVERWQLEENLAAFAILRWRPVNEIEFASINVLKTDCSLEDYLQLTEDDLRGEWSEFAEPQYIRLDLDYSTLGPIGTHPLPHLHIRPNGMRLPLHDHSSANVIVDFLEFIYRSFYPDAWLKWAEHVWNLEYRRAGRPPEQNPFRPIVAAFAEHQMGFLKSHLDDLEQIASVLTAEKDGRFDLRLNSVDRRIMSFPALRVLA